MPSLALPAVYTSVWLLAVRVRPLARFVEEPSAACTSSSESWAACQPELAVMSIRTNRARVAGKATVTVLAAPGVKA